MTATLTPSHSATRAPSTPWIVSPSYDLVFFIASLVPPLLLWGGFAVGVLPAVAVFAIFQLAFNMPHNVQTWTMSVLDDEDRAKNGRRYAVALLVIGGVFGGSMALSPEGLFPWVRDGLVYWGYYHLVRQHFGFQRLYERRMALAGSAPTPLESKLYARYLEIVSYAPLLLRFRDPELMTIRVGGPGVWIRHPVLPAWAWQSIAAIYVATIVAAIVHHAILAARGRKQLVPRALLLLSVTLCFGLAAIVIRNIVVAIAIVTSFHNLQYLGLVWFHNRTRAELAEQGGAARDRNVTVDWLRDRRWGLYGAMTFGYGILLLLPVIAFPTHLLAQLPITVVVALHYYVDSRLWHFGDYPARARYLRLRP